MLYRLALTQVDVVSVWPPCSQAAATPVQLAVALWLGVLRRDLRAQARSAAGVPEPIELGEGAGRHSRGRIAAALGHSIHPARDWAAGRNEASLNYWQVYHGADTGRPTFVYYDPIGQGRAASGDPGRHRGDLGFVPLQLAPPFGEAVDQLRRPGGPARHH